MALVATGDRWMVQYWDRIGVEAPHKIYLRDVRSTATFLRWRAQFEGGPFWYTPPNAYNLPTLKFESREVALWIDHVVSYMIRGGRRLKTHIVVSSKEVLNGALEEKRGLEAVDAMVAMGSTRRARWRTLMEAMGSNAKYFCTFQQDEDMDTGGDIEKDTDPTHPRDTNDPFRAVPLDPRLENST